MRIIIPPLQSQAPHWVVQSNMSPMANHSKAKNTSNMLPSRCLTRSHMQSDATQNTPIGGAERSTVKTVSKGKNNNGLGVKRKLEDAKLEDKPDAPDVTKSTIGSKNEKRAKKTELRQSTYINPFLPEPSLSVAHHEAHSHALTQTPHTASNDSCMDGQSFFSRSLALSSTFHQDSLSAPSKISSSGLKSRSQAPARPPLALAPLAHRLNTKTTSKNRNFSWVD